MRRWGACSEFRSRQRGLVIRLYFVFLIYPSPYRHIELSYVVHRWAALHLLGWQYERGVNHVPILGPAKSPVLHACLEEYLGYNTVRPLESNR